MIYTAGVFLINKHNQLLIGHVTNSSNVWSIPKGMMDEGETGILTAKREFLEEANVDLSGVKYWHQLPDRVYKNKKKTISSFLIFESENPSLELDKADIKCTSMVKNPNGPDFPEIDHFDWVSLEQAQSLLHEAQASLITNVINLINER